MFVCLDLETTGFDPEKDRIIEIAACRFEKGKIYEEWSSFINPGAISIPEQITAITGIHRRDLEDAPAFHKILPELKNFISDFPLVGHNIGFDLTFLKAAGLTLQNSVYDTHELVRVLSSKETSYALEILAQKWGFKNQPRHRAKYDVLATIELFEILLDKIQKISSRLYPTLRAVFQKSDWPYKNLFALHS